MSAADIVAHALPALPRNVAILCPDCGHAVPLVLFVDAGRATRQVHCPACACDVVLRDAR